MARRVFAAPLPRACGMLSVPFRERVVYVRYLIFALFVLPATYVHLRGRVRLRPWRQMTDHSTFLAPLNVVMYACSRVRANPYAPLDAFPELAPLCDRWQDIRDEAIALREAQRIRASERYDDVGFNSFFRRGWKRFYLKWYDDAHPSARMLCPRTTEILHAIPNVKAAMFAELPPGTHRASIAIRTRDRCAITLGWSRRATITAI